MSLKTWKAEFYPTPARKFLTELEAVEHSLRKWRGLTKENLEKHKVRKEICYIVDGLDTYFTVDCSTCALCLLHYHGAESAECDKCVLKRVNIINGKHYSCDASASGFSSYEHFLSDANPQPMIDLLEKAKAYLCQNSQQNNTSSSDLKS